MSNLSPVAALGLMSGTSLDGIDVVRVTTDGSGFCQVEGHFYAAYAPELRAALSVAARGDVPLSDLLRLERTLTQAYVAAIAASKLADGVAVVGVHGQTIRHLPLEGLTWQLGDANYIAEKVGLPVVMDFRRRDMAAGGEGAPLVPLFHAEMLGGKAGAILNLGGVANVTVMDGKGGIVASDCGPGVGLLDTWVRARTGGDFDMDGALALAGKADMRIVERAMREVGFWQRPVPRSADRYDFDAVLGWLESASVEDGAATLAALTAAGVRKTLEELNGAGGVVYAAGGGARHNGVMQGLKGIDVRPVQELGWDEQTVEAACFAWLAVRRLRGLHTTVPATTHCVHATVGGVLTS